MYHSILVPLDGSKFAEEALPVAAAIAKNASACLEVAEVHTWFSQQCEVSGWDPQIYPAQEAAAKEQNLAYLGAVVEQLKTTASVSATSTLLSGPVAVALLERVRARHVDLIVMSTHGRGVIGRFCLGSVAFDLLCNGSAPILLVRPETPCGRPQPIPKLSRVMVALDGSDLAERAIEPAISLSAYEYLLVRVVERPVFSNRFATASDETAARQSAEAKTYLDAVAARLRSRGLRIQIDVVVNRSTAAAILETAQKESIDVIALATHGRTGLRRLLLGSVAGHVVERTHKPVLVCRSAVAC